MTTDSTKTPTTLFPNTTWEQITDRFLWCSNTAGETGGSKTITTANLPAHSHNLTAYTWTGSVISNDNNEFHCSGVGVTRGVSSSNELSTNLNKCGATKSTGSGTDYMPPYYTVLAWKRIS